MDENKEFKAKSRRTAAKTIFASFKILKEAGGQLPVKEVIKKLSESLIFDEWELSTYEKTGYVRWKSIFNFYTINCEKAGYLRRNKGIMTLTEEGAVKIPLGSYELLKNVIEEYKKWKELNKKEPVNDDKDEELDEEDSGRIAAADLRYYEEIAIDALTQYVDSKNPYEFQDMVAALLKAMGYHIPFIAPPGKDGGLDLLAYQDPLGVIKPRIKVQVKHREQKVNVEPVRSLASLISRDEDVGLIVSSGGFTSDAVKEARTFHHHIELMDFERFIDLWKQYYDKMPDEDKNLLPLQKIYFLGANE